MRQATFVSLAFAFSLAFVSAAHAEDVAGRWRNPAEAGDLLIYPCGDKICGKGVPSDTSKPADNVKDVKNKNPELRNRSLNGLEVMHGFSGGPKVWSGASIYRPADGNTYSGHPLASAAAIATLDLYASDDLPGRAKRAKKLKGVML